MDPSATLAVLRDESADLAERIDAGRILQGWLRNGGYVPAGLFTCGETYGGHQAANAAAVRLISAETITLEQTS